MSNIDVLFLEISNTLEAWLSFRRIIIAKRPIIVASCTACVRVKFDVIDE